MTTTAPKSASSLVAPGVHRLTGGVTNFYLLEEAGGLTLVDAGTPRDWRLFQEVVSGLGRGIAALEAVVLTHAHADHTGFAERARSEIGAQVWIHDDDVYAAKGGTAGRNDRAITRYLWRAELYRTVLSLTRRGGAKIVPIVEVTAFADGEVLDVPGNPRAIHAPGHTSGNATLLVEDRGVLLSGDTLVTHNPLTGRRGPQIMPSGFNADTAAALDSLAVLEPVHADAILPGHGEPWTGGVSEALLLARNAGPS